MKVSVWTNDNIHFHPGALASRESVRGLQEPAPRLFPRSTFHARSETAHARNLEGATHQRHGCCATDAYQHLQHLPASCRRVTPHSLLIPLHLAQLFLQSALLIGIRISCSCTVHIILAFASYFTVHLFGHHHPIPLYPEPVWSVELWPSKQRPWTTTRQDTLLSCLKNTCPPHTSPTPPHLGGSQLEHRAPEQVTAP